MKKLILTLILLHFSGSLSAQFCSQRYDGSNSRYYVDQTDDGGYVIAGNADFGAGGTDVYLIRTDFMGNLIWSRTYGGASNESAYAVYQTDDGGYIIGANTRSFVSPGINSNIYLIKTDAAGDTLWTRTYATNANSTGADLKITADGSFVVVGRKNTNMYVLKTDAGGDSIWQRSIAFFNPFDPTFYESSNADACSLTADGGYIIAGQASISQYANPLIFGNSVALVKVDGAGVPEWQNHYAYDDDCQSDFFIYDVVQLSNGGYLVSAQGYGLCSDSPALSHVIKTDQTGEMLWRNVEGSFSYSMLPDNNDGALVAGFAVISPLYGIYDIFTAKLDANGEWEWLNYFDEPNARGGDCIRPTTDGGYIMSGRYYEPTTGESDVYLVKLDSLGNSCKNYIFGQAFYDANGNCLPDTLETPFNDLLIETQPGPLYTLTNNTGAYHVPIDSGSFTVNAYPPNELWDQTCPSPMPGYNVYLDAATPSIDSVFFAFAPNALCPLMSVSAGMTQLRPCIENNIYIQLCNNGTQNAPDVAVTVAIPQQIDIFGSSHPYIQNDTVYTFEMGELAWGECQTIQINGELSCDAIMGEQLCTDISILPNNDCGVLQANAEEHLCRTVFNSYDPNNKLVITEQGADCLTAIEDELHYTINFQNTGNDTAYRVMIVDSLPPELAMASVQSLVASHEHDFQIHSSNVLVWVFDGIMLPDSAANEAASQGFIRFSIKPDVSLSLIPDWVVSNRAHIYFDHNPPITTEPATIAQCEPETAIETLGMPPFDFSLTPNPAQTKVEMEMTLARAEALNIAIVGLEGKTLAAATWNAVAGKNRHLIDISGLTPGVYLVKVGTPSTFAVKKMVVK